MSLSMSLSMVQRLESPFFPETCLPTAERLLETRAQPLCEAGEYFVATQDGCRSLMDFLVGLLIPTLRSSMRRYYEGNGGRLVETLGPRGLAKLEARVTGRIAALAAVYLEVERQLPGKPRSTLFEVAARAARLEPGWFERTMRGERGRHQS